eukprot:scaffold8272_cov248-Pinguiococcus_pyrenoidosus.AAC.7
MSPPFPRDERRARNRIPNRDPDRDRDRTISPGCDVLLSLRSAGGPPAQEAASPPRIAVVVLTAFQAQLEPHDAAIDVRASSWCHWCRSRSLRPARDSLAPSSSPGLRLRSASPGAGPGSPPQRSEHR